MIAPRVTVLMPVYNGERYLRDAMDSILGQTFTDFQFLIINDGSIDNSVNIIKSYNDKRISLIHNERNLGLVTSLNNGFALAQGEFIARMDSDDICRPDRLMLQVAFMDANPLVGVCGSWVHFFRKDKDKVWKLPAKSEEIRCWQFHTVGVAHPSVMIRRQLFIEHGLGYDPNYSYIEDFELWGRAIQNMLFANIQKVLLEYRISPGQICALNRAEQLAAMAPLRLKRVRELGIDPTPDQQQLHEMIMNGELPAESVQLDRAEKWLMHLDSANRGADIYVAHYFSRRLLDIWFSICAALAVDSVCTLRRCLMSPLWSTVNHSGWHQARASAAWIIRKKS